MKFSAILFTTIAVASSASAFIIPQADEDFSVYRREAEISDDLDFALFRRVVEGRRSRSASPATADSPIRPNSATQIHTDAHGNVNLNIDPHKAPSHADSVNAAHRDGYTPMANLPLATKEEHEIATKFMKNKKSAGPGKVKEDEPPRIAKVKNSERHIQPADRHESSKVQAGAVKQQKKEFLRQKEQGHDPKLSYTAVDPKHLHKVLDGRIEKPKASGAKTTSKHSSPSSSRHSSPGKRDELVATLEDAYMAGYKRAIEHLSVLDLNFDLEDF